MNTAITDRMVSPAMGDMVDVDVGVDHACMLSKFKGITQFYSQRRATSHAGLDQLKQQSVLNSAEEAYLEKMFEKKSPFTQEASPNRVLKPG